MRVLLTAVTYLVSLAVLAPLLFFAVMLLAGPHSSMLPSMMQSVVVLLGYLILIVAPVLVARAVWLRPMARPPHFL